MDLVNEWTQTTAALLILKSRTLLPYCYIVPNIYLYKMVSKNISFCQVLGLFWPIHRQFYSYIARASENGPNNSCGTPTKNPMHLARWCDLPNTYQYKMVTKNISFCQILGFSTPTRNPARLARWYALPTIYQYKMVPKNIYFC
jgi:hypothetical protein